MSGVVVSYSGVHQAYQAALAAQEVGCLNKFLCSVYDAPGLWGRVLSERFGEHLLLNRKVENLNTAAVEEQIFPLLFQRVKSRLFKSKTNNWLFENNWFDKWAEKRINKLRPNVVFGTETCCKHIFSAAKRLHATTVLDCPQVHPAFLADVYQKLSDQLGVRLQLATESSRMTTRREFEYGNADWMITYSDVHRQSFISAGFKPEQVKLAPLWADTSLWYPNERPSVRNGKLKALFVGGVSIRKGIPFLLESIKEMEGQVDLTIVGGIQEEVLPWLNNLPNSIKLKPATDRIQLRDIYCEHDVLILPSLIDSFGFVAMEAMACGLPVIVSVNCGVPVPSEAWRVPILDSHAISERLSVYVLDRNILEQDGKLALEFSKTFTPMRFRAILGGLFKELCR